MSFVCKALQNTNFARASCNNLQKLHEFGSHIDQIVMYITTVSSLTYGEYLDMMNQYLENEITREELMFRPNTMIAKEAKRHHELGLHEGYQRGVTRGREEGTEEGAVQSQQLIIHAMREKGYSDQEITEITGITIEH